MRLLLTFVVLAAVLMALITTNRPTLPDSPLPSGALAEAASAYEAGRFAAAATVYQAAVDAGVRNGQLFYNLGNAYFKQGDIGRAILNYRRAMRLTPRDADLRANLDLAQAQTKDQLEDSSPTFLQQIATQSERWLTLNEMALLSLGLWFLLLGLLLVYQRVTDERWREAMQYALFGVTMLLLVSVTLLGSYLYVEANQPAAIIVAERVDVSSGPGTQFLVEFTLHSGTAVRLLEQRDEWTRLVLPGSQLQGWVAAEAVERVEK